VSSSFASHLDPLTIDQVPLGGLPHRLEGVGEPHDRGISLDRGTPLLLDEVLQGGQRRAGFGETLVQSFHTTPSRCTRSRNLGEAVARSTMSTS
jgi:hypothetical protein